MAGPGQDYSTFAELITEAHKRGLKGMTNNLLEHVFEDGKPVYAVVEATATFENGVYQGIGDATRENTNRGISPHLIRMASTRAMARALRVALGVGKTAIEELGGSESPEQSSTPQGGGGGEEPERTEGGATVRAAGFLRDLAHKNYGSVEAYEESELNGGSVEKMSAKAVKQEIERLK